MKNDPFVPRTIALGALALVFIFILAGCLSPAGYHRHQASSVVQFLYPGKDQPFIAPGIPTLRLPLRVGIAFVPPAGNMAGPARFNPGLSEMEKTVLLRTVAAQFRALPFVQSIEIVPATYLRPGGGFENLDQVRALLGVDVIALIAYDQAQLTTETAWSLSYWTIVGAYIVPARKNDTATLMEAVVYDIPSRCLLFRAPGTSTIRGHSTPVESEAVLSADSAKSYAAAAADLTANLQLELDAFKVRTREEPASIHLEHRPGYTGAGGLTGGFALPLALLLAALLLRSRR